MSLLDELAGLPLDQILQHLGPSLLTSPDPAAAAQPLNQQAASIGIPQMGQPTQEQLAAQQAPTYRAGFPGGRTLQKLLDAIAPVPEPYKQLLSGDEQRRMQLQSLGQIGGGLTGAYTRPGESQWFGQNLTRGMDASHETMNTALEPTAKAVGLGNVMQQMQVRQLLSRMDQAPPGESHEAAAMRYLKLAALANHGGLTTDAERFTQIAAQHRQMAKDENGPDAPAPKPMEHISLGGEETLYNPNTGRMLRSGGNPDNPKDWVAQAPRTMTADQKQEFDFRMDQARATTQARGFTSQTKQYTDGHQAFVSLQPMLQTANDPTASPDVKAANNKSLIINYARFMDPNVRLAQSMVEYVAKVNESLPGRLKITASMLEKGSLPPEITDAMRQNAERKYKSLKTDYQKKWEFENQKNPFFADIVSPAEGVFTADLSPAPTVSPGYDSYLPPKKP